MSKQMKMESNNEEKIVFIVIGVIVLVAVAVLLIWYFAKGKEEEDIKEPKNPTKEIEKEKEKDKAKEDEPVVVIPVEFILPNGLLKEAIVGDEIIFNPKVIVDGNEVLAVVKVQQYVDGKWLNVNTAGDKFIPTEAGEYRLVYSYGGTSKYQLFTVKDKEVPVIWTLPNLPTVTLVNREIIINPNVLVNGQSKLAMVKIQLFDSKWIDMEITNKFTPEEIGLYRFVYTYNNETKYSEFKVLGLLEVNSVNEINLGAFPEPTDESSEDYERFQIIRYNLDSVEVIDNEIFVYSTLKTFDTTRPLKTPVGFTIQSDGFIGASVTSNTNGVYIDSMDDQETYRDLGIIDEDEILVWLDFKEFDYNVLNDMVLDVDDESLIFSFIFRNNSFVVEAAPELSEIDPNDDEIEANIINDNLSNLEVSYDDKLNIDVTLLDDMLEDANDKAFIGLLISYDDKKVDSIIEIDPNDEYYLDIPNTASWKNLLNDTQFLLWLDTAVIGSNLTIDLIIDDIPISFTVQITRLP